jgi:hypothetical protein
VDQLRAATALATEAAAVVQSSDGAALDSSENEAAVRWEVRDESSNEYTADFEESKEDADCDQANDDKDDKVDEDDEDDNESAIVELLYERSVLAEQARVLSAACQRDLAPTAAADFLSELSAAEAPEASPNYLLLYRLHYCKSRLREVDDEIGDLESRARAASMAR